MSLAEENKALVRRFVEAFANGDLQTLDELLAPDYVDHSLFPGQEAGRVGFMQTVAEEHAIFSDFRTIIEDQAVDGDKVITRLTNKRIHDRGEFMGVAPTGMEFKTTVIVIHRIVEGKIVEEWSESTGVAEAMRRRLEQERSSASALNRSYRWPDVSNMPRSPRKCPS